MSIERDLRRAFKGSGTVTDPYWSNVSALVLTNSTGPTSNKTALDETSGVTFTIGASTVGGPAYTYLSPFTNSPGSYYSSGTYGGSGLKSSANSNLNFAGDFTVECWVMIPSGTSLSGYPSPIINGDNAGFFAYGPTAGYWSANSYGGAISYAFNSSVVSNDGVWRHLALSRSGTSLRFFIDGTQIGTTATASGTTNYSGSNFMCGVGAGPGAGDNQCPGYISNVRFSNSARYTSNFTPPTTKFTVDANTKFLWLGNGAFWDVSPIKNTITQLPATTVVQNSSIKKWSTLNSIESSGTANINSLTMPSNSSFALPGSYTIECWVYVSSATTLNANSIIYYSPGIIIYARKAGGSNVFSAVVDTDNSDFVSTVNSKDSAWHHIALVRSQSGGIGNITYFFVDGVMYGSSQRNTSYSQAVQYIGSGGSAGDQLIGYIDELRITKGVARYTSNFTVPDAPFPTS